MSWVLFSILAAMSWAVVNLLDKYILTKLVRNPTVLLMMLGLVGAAASLIIYLVRGFDELSNAKILLALLAGGLYVLMTLFYFKAVKIEEISRLVPLFYLCPLFILILAAIFLGEIFTPLKYLGIFLLIIGAVLVSTKKLRKISLGKAFWFMVFSTLLLSIREIIAKYLLNFADYWTIFSYLMIGAFIALIPIFYLKSAEVKITVKKSGKKAVGLVCLGALLNLLGVIFITKATSIGYVTLVNALSSVQPFFVLVVAAIISVVYPKILKEEIGRSTLLIKSIAIGLIFLGAILVT